MTQAGSNPVYSQIAAALRPRVDGWEAGGWPSVRAIAGEFNVSVVTASRAIQVLKDSKERAPAIPEEERWAVCLHVTPGPYYHAAYQVTAAGFREAARSTGGRFDLDAVRLDDSPSESAVRGRLRAAAEAGAAGLFLLPSRVGPEAAARDEALLSAAAELGLPVVLIERNRLGMHRPLSHDLVCFHDFAGGFELTQHLHAAGRRRVAFVGGFPTSSHTERLGGYLAAVVGAGFEPLVVDQPAELPLRDAYRAVVDGLLAAEADAAVCYHDHAAVGVFVELLRRGVRVPADVGVAGFYNMPIGESLSIGLTTYDFPAETVARRAVDQMRWRRANADAPPLKVVVPGRLVVRDSTDSEAAR